MSDDRNRIYQRIRAGLALSAERRPHPEYDDASVVSRRAPAPAADLSGAPDDSGVATFCERLAAVDGHAFMDVAALAAWLNERGMTHGYCDPALKTELALLDRSGIVCETAFERGRIDDYQFGITRAAGGIAETGSIILNDATTSTRLAALAPWVHIAVLDRASIHRTLADAVRALGNDPNVIWVTGPSKTADIEGILIQGVHGPGEQVALLL